MIPPPPPQQTVTPVALPRGNETASASAGDQRPAVAGRLPGAVRHGRDHDRGRAVQHDLRAVPGVQIEAAHDAALAALDDLHQEALGQGLLDAAKPLRLPAAAVVRAVAKTEVRYRDG